MIDWLQSLDVSLFRLINLSWRNDLFDTLMPLASDAPFFGVILVATLVWVFCKGGTRGRVMVLLLILGLCFTDGLVLNTLKHAVGRLRPFFDIPDALVPASIGKTTSGSMPSSHAGNWFAATMIVGIYYRRALALLLPLALLVCYSRVYNGVHYPSDVLAGAILGAGSAAGFVWTCHSLWQWAGPKWFSSWHAQMPSLLNPVRKAPARAVATPISDANWMRLGYLFIAVLFLVRIWYLAAGKIGISEDESYQWLWSKHIALSYFSKPPLIAYTQFLGTHLFGDNIFGVRFFSPVIASILSLLTFRFMAREVSPKAAVLLMLIISVTIMMAVGATLMTIDPLSVMFWMAAMIAGWKAAQPDGATRHWLWVGVWMGMGFLSKYTNLFQWLSWALFFILWAPARKHLRRPGPYLALVVNALFSLPVLIWNAQHHWITVDHVASDGHLHEAWHFSWRFVGDFVGSEFGLLNPVFFVGMIWAAIAFWKRRNVSSRFPLQLYLFSMGAPVFLFYFLFSFHSRVLPNWIAPSVLPLFCLMLVYFYESPDSLKLRLKPWIGGGIVAGMFVVILTHDTNLIGKLIHRTLPPKIDVLRRVRGGEAMAQILGKAQAQLEAESGRPTFIIGDHYGITSQVSFYLPEARKRAQTGAEALVYYQTSDAPDNQFYFWPDYKSRKGQNAIYMREIDRPPMRNDWIKLWALGRTDYYETTPIKTRPAPARLLKEFEFVKDLGVRDVVYRGRVMQRLQLFECRNLQ